MKNIFAAFVLFIALCGSAHAGLKAVVGGGGSSSPNVSNATGTLPVANGGTGFTTGQASGLYGTFLTTGTVYNSFGDSISSGTGAAPASASFVNLIAADSNAVVNNLAISGEMACDMGQNEIFNLTPLSLTSNSFNTMMVGTNEAAQKGVGTYEAVYKNCHQSELAWLAVPASYKVYAQNAACVQAGTWAVDSSIITGIAEKSTTNGSTLTCSVPTYGGAVYLWYQQKDSNGGVFTYAVDGGSAVSVNAFTSPAIATGNGGTLGIGYVRLTGIASGTHSIVFTVTSATSASNIVSIYSVGTAPQLYYANQNTVFSSGLIPEESLANNAATLAYDADAQADALLLAGDGLPIRFAPIQPYFTAMCPGATSACMFNSLHPNNAGHELIHEAFGAIMQYPKSALPVVAIGGVNYLTTNSANLASTTALNPGIVFYSASGNPFGIDLGNNGSYYDTRIFTAASGGIAFGIQATNPTGQSNFTQWAAFKGGFLGIGVTTPAAPLDVNGAIDISSTNGFSCPTTDSSGTCASIAIGNQALRQEQSLASTAFSNIAIGYAAMSSVSLGTTAINNVAVGTLALEGVTTGNANTALGGASLQSLTTGGSNTALGQAAGNTLVGGAANTAIGAASLLSEISGNNNVAVGINSGNHATGSSNTIVGAGSQALTSGSNNTILGFKVGSVTLTTGTGNILIGTQAGVDTQATSSANTLNIGNLIYGTGLATSGTTPIGSAGIGITSPATKWDVYGTSADPATWPTPHALARIDGTNSVVIDMGIMVSSPFSGWIQVGGDSGAQIYPLSLNPLGGSVGIGTTTPIGSSALTINGVTAFTGTAPTCGTGCASITASSTNARGSMVSSSSVSSITLNFATTGAGQYSTTPFCTISDSNSTAVSDISAVSSTALTVSLASALSAVTIYYICQQ